MYILFKIGKFTFNVRFLTQNKNKVKEKLKLHFKKI